MNTLSTSSDQQEQQEQLESRRMQQSYCTALDELAHQLRAYCFLREEEEELRRIACSSIEPFKLAVFGRMKTGKSTLINTLIGEQLAITGVEEATATINQLCYSPSREAATHFTVHWKDPRELPSELSLEELSTQWTGKSEQLLERIQRVSHLQLYSHASILEQVQIIDTPGIGSEAEAHEQIAQQFIAGQQTDALLYVFYPVGHEVDANALQCFRSTCLPTSAPYNSVAVLHKWDHIYWQEKGDWQSIEEKVQRLHGQMSDLVAAVLPVSAPLALISLEPDDYWDACMEQLSAFASEQDLCRVLCLDCKWELDESRAAFYQRSKQKGLAWASFQIMMRELYRRSQGRLLGREAAAIVRELSGIDRLHELLDKQIFKRTSAIRLRQMRAQAGKALHQAYGKIDTELKIYRRDLDTLSRAQRMLTDSSASKELQKMRDALEEKHQHLYAQWLRIDELRRDSEQSAESEDVCLELEDWLRSESCHLSAELKKATHHVLDSWRGRESPLVLLDCCAAIFNECASMLHGFGAGSRAHGERLQQMIATYIQRRHFNEE